jgi:hypothetical protein
VTCSLVSLQGSGSGEQKTDEGEETGPGWLRNLWFGRGKERAAVEEAMVGRKKRFNVGKKPLVPASRFQAGLTCMQGIGRARSTHVECNGRENEGRAWSTLLG